MKPAAGCLFGIDSCLWDVYDMYEQNETGHRQPERQHRRLWRRGKRHGNNNSHITATTTPAATAEEERERGREMEENQKKKRGARSIWMYKHGTTDSNKAIQWEPELGPPVSSPMQKGFSLLLNLFLPPPFLSFFLSLFLSPFFIFTSSQHNQRP